MERQCAFLGIVACLATGTACQRDVCQAKRVVPFVRAQLADLGAKTVPKRPAPQDNHERVHAASPAPEPNEAEPPDAQLTVEQWLNEQAVAAWFGSKEKTTEGEAQQPAGQRQTSGTKRNPARLRQAKLSRKGRRRHRQMWTSPLRRTTRLQTPRRKLDGGWRLASELATVSPEPGRERGDIRGSEQETASQASAQERDSPATVRVQVILGCSPLRPRNLAPPPARTRQKPHHHSPSWYSCPRCLAPGTGRIWCTDRYQVANSFGRGPGRVGCSVRSNSSKS